MPCCGIMQLDTSNALKESKPKHATKAYHAGMTMLRQGHFEARRPISSVGHPFSMSRVLC